MVAAVVLVGGGRRSVGEEGAGAVGEEGAGVEEAGGNVGSEEGRGQFFFSVDCPLWTVINLLFLASLQFCTGEDY